MENYKAYLRLRAILMAAWDPCDIAEFEGAYDEYDGYIPSIYAFVIRGETELLSDFLHHVETDSMGLTDWRKSPDTLKSASYRLAASNIMAMYCSDAEYPSHDSQSEAGQPDASSDESNAI